MKHIMKIIDITSHRLAAKRGTLTSGDFIELLNDAEYSDLINSGEVGQSLYDVVVAWAKKHTPNITIKREPDTPVIRNQYRIVDDETDTDWRQNNNPLKAVS